MQVSSRNGSKIGDHKNDEDSDSDFEREPLPRLNERSRPSPMKDDSEVLRQTRSEYLKDFG